MKQVNWIMDRFGTKDGYLKLLKIFLIFIVITSVGTFVHRGMYPSMALQAVSLVLVMFAHYLAEKNDHTLLDPVALFLMTSQWSLNVIPAILGPLSPFALIAMLLQMPIVVLFLLWLFVIRKDLLPDYDRQTWMVPKKLK